MTITMRRIALGAAAGAVAEHPSTAAILTLGVTVGATWTGPDFNNNGTVTVQDLFDFLAAWFAGDIRADFNGSGTVTVQDLFDFIGAWFGGCA